MVFFKKISLTTVFLSLFCLLSFVLLAQTAMPTTPSVPTIQASTASPTLTTTPVPTTGLPSDVTTTTTDLSVSDLIGAVEDFNDQKEKIESSLAQVGDLAMLKLRFASVQMALGQFTKVLASKNKLSSWDLNRANAFKEEATPLLFQPAEKLKTEYLDFIKTTEDLLLSLNDKKKNFVSFYLKLTKDPSLAAQKNTVLQGIKTVDEFMVQIRKSRLSLAGIYQAEEALFNDVKAFQKSLDEEIHYFKQSRFQKTADAFYEEEFRGKFDGTLLTEMKLSWQESLRLDFSRLFGQRNKYFQILGLVFLLWLGLGKLRPASKTENKGVAGMPLFKRPFLVSLTLALGVAAFHIDRPPAALVILYWVLLAVLITMLVKTVLPQPQDRRDILVLVALYCFLQIVDTVGLPLVFYRVFLFILALGVAAYCYHKLSVLMRQGERNFTIETTLQVLIMLFVFAMATEFFGYHLFTVMILQGAIKSTFLIFAVLNLRLFILELVRSVFTRTILARIDTVKRYHDLMYQKIQFILHLLLVGFVVVILSTIWGLYDDFALALSGILDLGLSFKTQRLTVSMVLEAVVLFTVSQAISFIICRILEDEVYPRKKIVGGIGKSINSLITYLAWVIGFFLAFSALGFRLEQFAIIAGALSVGIGFGLQNIVNNFVSGLILLFERPIKVGDLLELSETEWGTVEKVGLRSTLIRSQSNAEIIIPNSEFVTQKVRNLTLSDSDLRAIIPVSVAYGSNVQLVKQVLETSASQHQRVSPDPRPIVHFRNFGVNGMEFELWFWVYVANERTRVVSDILFEIERLFREKKITIPFPQMDVRLTTNPSS